MSLRWRFLISSFFLAFRGSLGKRPGIEFAKSNPATRNARRQTRLRVPRRICARGLLEISLPSNQRAQGIPGSRCTRGLVCNSAQNKRTRAYRFSGGNPAFPAQWFYGLFRALPGDRAFLPPSPALLSANLTPASGRQDHTTSPSASHAVRQERIRVHRIPPRVRDDRETPLEWDETANHIVLIWGSEKQKYFFERYWTETKSADELI